MAPKKNSDNLVVDLDGTLVATDTLWEAYLKLIKQNPLAALSALGSLLAGKANFKHRVCQQVTINVALLPYNQAVVQYINRRKAGGSYICLATAADQSIARAVAGHLNIFDEVLSSNRQFNLGGKNKAKKLVGLYGQRNFDYIGDAKSDRPVWAASRQAFIVSSRKKPHYQTGSKMPAKQFIGQTGYWPVALLKSFRPFHWIKNLPLFIPLIADHQFYWQTFSHALLAFFSFSLAASAVYLINDLLDLESDRQHPVKKNRPLASGQLSLLTGALALPVLIIMSIALAAFLPPAFFVFLAAYLILNIFYSMRLKQIVIVDVILLAGLYTLRVVAGGAAVDIKVSEWLMALVLFLSLSGALLKRYVELHYLKIAKQILPAGRGYSVNDRLIVGQFGVISGYLSVLVLALYVNSETVKELYTYPNLWWLNVLLLLYLVTRIWLLAYRGQITHDPIIFLLRDRQNYLAVALAVLLLFLAI